jgi:hypothetical protein
MSKRRRLLVVVGAFLLLVFPLLWVVSSVPATARGPAPTADVRVAATVSGPADLAALAQRDPLELVRLGRARYDRVVRDYRCVLVKQERLGDTLTPVQEIEFRYREQPHSVYMIWRANADGARRALYIDQSDFVDGQGRKAARVEPAGAVARLFVKDIMIPLHGAEARKASRRSMDEAGFRATFELLENYNAIAAQRGVLNLRYGGTGGVDGRPTYVIVRELPYEGPAGPYPDARLVLHLDQEWLLPVAIYSYADRAEQSLLGSYVFTQVELNPGFDADAFRF